MYKIQDNLTVAVVIPTFNRAHCIEEAIRSVLSQSMLPDEIIVVDDGSTDETASVLEIFGSRITTVRQTNQGAGAARNAGVLASSSEWIAFLDSDDKWLPERIEILHRDLKISDERVVGHTGNLILESESYRVDVYKTRDYNFPKGRSVRVADALPFAITGIHPPASAVRASALKRAGGFHQTVRIYEDAPLFCRLAVMGDWLFTGDALAVARRLNESVQPLTAIEEAHPVEAAEAKIAYLQEVSGLDLTKDQKMLIRRSLSGAYLKLARAKRRSKSGGEGEALIKSVYLHPKKLKGTLKALISAVFGEVGYRFVSKERRRIKR